MIDHLNLSLPTFITIILFIKSQVHVRDSFCCLYHDGISGTLDDCSCSNSTSSVVSFLLAVLVYEVPEEEYQDRNVEAQDDNQQDKTGQMFQHDLL